MSFFSQIIPYQDSDLERLYCYLRHLSAKLPRRRTGPAYQFDDLTWDHHPGLSGVPVI
jgi:type I restriction enzyme R subunit